VEIYFTRVRSGDLLWGQGLCVRGSAEIRSYLTRHLNIPDWQLNAVFEMATKHVVKINVSMQ
jgi:hypothetical protein